MTTVRRRTKETDVTIEVPAAKTEVSTTLPFLDHMLEVFARYADLSLRVSAVGDLDHHLAEDVALTLAEAVKQVVPAEAVRYGSATVPMDDALVDAAIDVGGRPYYAGPLADETYDHFLRSFAIGAGFTLHVDVRRGHDSHHLVECALKAVGLALRQAMRTGDSVFSTKGSVQWEVTP